MKRDSLGSRMKANYEDRYRAKLPRRTYTIIRLDGKAFHTWTKDFKRPYDVHLMDAFAYGAEKVLRELQGAQLAYLQSDEVSLLLTDFSTTQTEAAYDGNIQKLCSISSSIMTASFNSAIQENAFLKYPYRQNPPGLAFFDSRVFTIPDPIEVYNYFVWRQQDCIRNSIQSLGQHYLGHSKMHGLNTSQVQDALMKEKNINWSEEFEYFKNGTLITKQNTDAALVFTQDPAFLRKLIPIQPSVSLSKESTLAAYIET